MIKIPRFPPTFLLTLLLIGSVLILSNKESRAALAIDSLLTQWMYWPEELILSKGNGLRFYNDQSFPFPWLNQKALPYPAQGETNVKLENLPKAQTPQSPVITIGHLEERFNRFQIKMGNSVPEGGISKAEFKKSRPQVTLSRWSGASGFSVIYPKVHGRGQRVGDSEIVEWKGDKEDVRAYPLKADAQMEDGGIEMEIILKEKPRINKFDFVIKGARHLNFLYQPALNKEIPSSLKLGTDHCTETQCFDKKGRVMNTRPENVVGSYAVYHKKKRDHEIGKTNYATGKLFHIYRPKAIDRNGRETWATLAYAKGILSVDVPQDFLDNADYPVRIDPTYGYTTNGSSEDNTDDWELAYNAGSFGGTTGSTISSGSWRGRNGNGARTATVYLGLYSNGSGVPVTKRDEVSASLSLTTTVTTFTINVSGSYSMTNGTTYWLADSCTDGQSPIDCVGWKNEYDSNAAYDTSAHEATGSLPNSWTEDAAKTWNVSFYINYTSGTHNHLIQGGSLIRGGSVLN